MEKGRNSVRYNKYIEKAFHRDGLMKCFGMKSERSGEDVLEYIRKRRIQIAEEMNRVEERVRGFRGMFDSRGRRRLVECRAALCELDEIEDYVTDFYSRLRRVHGGMELYERVLGKDGNISE